MIANKKLLSVPEAASLIGVSRSTINHWINTKKIHARRSGRNYSVPVKELLLFLRATGKDIPSELKRNDLQGPLFKSFRHCWDYWKNCDHGKGCKDCLVYHNKIENCFTANESNRLNCTSRCYGCDYYQEIYIPRMHFIHQLNFPGAICKGLYVWGANSRWAEICQVSQKDFPGMGIEKIMHPKSLELIISNIKKMELGEAVPMAQNILLKNEPNGTLEATVSFFPLNNPSGTFLVLAKPAGGE
jgi:excisionase family DNA binding protein